MTKIEQLARDGAQHQIDIRRQIHTHPELGSEEVLTSDLVAKELTDMGAEVQRGQVVQSLS